MKYIGLLVADSTLFSPENETSRNKIMPRNCYVFWLKNNQNPFKNDFKLFFSLKKCDLYEIYSCSHRQCFNIDKETLRHLN